MDWQWPTNHVRKPQSDYEKAPLLSRPISHVFCFLIGVMFRFTEATRKRRAGQGLVVAYIGN